MKMLVEGFADGHFSAAHTEQGGERRLHGHTYQVRAWWAALRHYSTPDAVARQRELASVLERLDHSNLDETLGGGRTQEEVACWVLARLSWATRVRVWREPEGLGAEASR